MSIYNTFVGIGGYGVDIMVDADSETEAVEYVQEELIPNCADEITDAIEEEHGHSDGVEIFSDYDSEGAFYKVTSDYDTPGDQIFFREFDVEVKEVLGETFDELGYDDYDQSDFLDPNRAGFYL